MDEAVDLSNCDREPIQIPGSIQPHGVLLAVELPEMIIRQVSANCHLLVGRTPEQLIGETLGVALGEPAAAAIAGSVDEAASRLGIQLAPIIVGGQPLETRLHVAQGLMLCELEPVLEPAGDQTWFAREISQTLRTIQLGEGVDELAERAVSEVRRLTGYDRVMVYRFHPDGHGEVIAEARDLMLGSYLGQHYPATDIPLQARALYLRQILRQIVDIDYIPASLVPVHNPLTNRPLDLGFATLRSVSPIHLQYLRNMGVGATLTISLIHDAELWGMIACHHYSARYLSPQVRAACALIGEILPLQFAREEQADDRRARESLKARRRSALEALRDAATLNGGLREHGEQLRAVGDADGLTIVLDGERITCGTVPELEVERQLVGRLDAAHPSFCPDRLPGEFPQLASKTDLCGALAVSLPRGVGECIIWYRSEWRHELVWGGDPNETLTADLSSKDTKSLSPRRSFEAFRQTVVGRGRPWSGAQIQNATELARELTDQAVATMRDKLAHMALHDPLTGLANRTLLVQTLTQTLGRRPRAGREHVGVLFLDLDNFKLINDAFGHAGGDELLQEVAGRVTARLRSGDLVARIGGDEFLIVLQGVNDPAELDTAAQRLRSSFKVPFHVVGADTRISASIGVASAELGVPSAAEDLIREADLAMYEAKRRGRGRWVRYGQRLSAERLRRVEIERHLEDALGAGEIHLHYQPLLDDELTTVGFEALARWTSPELGRVGPDEFIPIAEESGLIHRLGAHVLDTALETLAQLHRNTELELFMGVNISAAQLTDITLPDQIDTLLERHRLNGNQVCLEITESTLIANTDSAVPILDRLRSNGVKIALDDFGTGFSSLAYLRRLPADILKIDRAFVAELENTETDAHVVAAVVDLARHLNIKTVAEGVETEEQLAILRQTRCNLFQGNLFSKPLPSDQLHRLTEFSNLRLTDQPNRGTHPRRSSNGKTTTHMGER